MNTFSTKEAFGAGWALTKANFWLLVGVVITMCVVGYLAEWVGASLNIREGAGVLLLKLIGFVLGGLVQLGAMRIALDLVDGKKPVYNDLFGQSNILLPYLGASIIVGIAVTIGVVLLIIPGIILGLMLGMYGYHMVDTKAGVMASINGSRALTKGHLWQLFGFILLSAIINIIGALLLGVGLLVTMPVTLLAYAFVYRKLSGQLVPAVAAPSAPTLIEDLRKTA